ncbi:protein EMBRYO SAC DEVELOPMENT ARREST [Salix suchowensis]|nr:protein EMBRYO SAC DEVELOPMENT ARREST [Salix suchowensis]
MDSTIRIGSSIVFPTTSSSSPKLSILRRRNKIEYGFRLGGNGCISAITPNGHVSPSAASHGEPFSVGDVHRRRSSLESPFRYDKPIPEERIEEPVGISLAEKVIGDNPRCIDCQAKGAVLCTTCAGSGLYVDSILESQGIIVKVRCLGCGGTGNIMCSECGGRGHVGLK